MKPLTQKTLFIFSSKPIFTISKTHFSTHHSSPSPSFQSRRHEEESRNVRVSVWWDFENCTLPVGANVFRASQSITAAIRANGIKGPVQITAFGDVLQLSRANQEALSSTGINLTHIPHGGKNSADRSLLVDLMYWVSQNPPPAHLFLISGDRDFASILHRLRMNNYNILLASPDSAPGVLCSAASVMWHWSDLVKGEKLMGKHFNQPPDGPYNSWYGHYTLPLEDPFAVTGQPACSRVESDSDSKVRPVPRSVMRQIRNILNLNPKGISMSELRSELGKTNVSVDKDLYGYKKFSRFLLSMPHLLKLQTGTEGQHLVHGVTPKVTESTEPALPITTPPVTNNGDSDLILNPKINSGAPSCVVRMDEKSSLSSSSKVNAKEPMKKLRDPPKQMEEPPLKVIEPPSLAEVTKSHVGPVEEQDPLSEVGFFKRIWKKWFGGSEENVKETEEKCLESTSQCVDHEGPTSSSSSTSGAIVDEDIAKTCEPNDDKSRRDPGLFDRIMTRCRFWSSNENSDNTGKQYSEKIGEKNIVSEWREIFSKESFWNDIVAFINTPKGSEVVLLSGTRKQMAQNLQKQGPHILKSLSESDLLRLVDLLISDKKLIEETPSQTSPFKLVAPVEDNSFVSKPPISKGLTSIFASDVEKKDQNVPRKQRAGKSRGEILADCQNLMDQIVKEYPNGLNVGSFKKLFVERFGYVLDLQKLGYQKLATLLQIMPGIKVECNYIIPCGNSDSESRNDNDVESQWDELGPVTNTSETTKMREENILNDYDSLSDDEFSESEEETLSSTGSDNRRVNEEDSSLLKILDSWYGAKEDSNTRVAPVNDDRALELKPSSLLEVGHNRETHVVRKKKPLKSYSFVSEQHGCNNKDKLIDGILGTLKKSGERSVESRMQG